MLVAAAYLQNLEPKVSSLASSPLQDGLIPERPRALGITRCGWGATAAGLMD
jgi:hypothetical protein